MIEAIKNRACTPTQFKSELAKIPLQNLINQIDENNGFGFLHYIIFNERFDFFEHLKAHLAHTPHIFKMLLSTQDNLGRTPLFLAVEKLIKAHHKNEENLQIRETIQWILELYPEIAIVANIYRNSIFDLLKAQNDDKTLKSWASLWEQQIKQTQSTRSQKQSLPPSTSNRVNFSNELFEFINKYSCTHEAFKNYLEEAKQQNNGHIEEIKNNNGESLWQFAIKTNDLDLVAWLLDNAPNGAYECDSNANTVLHLCIQYQRTEILSFLIETNQFNTVFSRIINLKNSSGKTALATAIDSVDDTNTLINITSLLTQPKQNQQSICQIAYSAEEAKNIFMTIVKKHNAYLLGLLLDNGLNHSFNNTQSVLSTLALYFNALQNREPPLNDEELLRFERVLNNFKTRNLAKILHQLIIQKPDHPSIQKQRIEALKLELQNLKSLLSPNEFTRLLNYHINGFTSLQQAIVSKQTTMAEILINAGADYEKISCGHNITTAKDLAQKQLPSHAKSFDDLAKKFNYQELAKTLRRKDLIRHHLKNRTNDQASNNVINPVQQANHRVINRELEKLSLNNLINSRNNHRRQLHEIVSYIQYLVIRVFDGVLNGLPATNFTRRIPGAGYNITINIDGISDQLQNLLGQLATDIYAVWGNQINQLKNLEPLIIAKLCETIRRFEPPFVDYNNQQIILAPLNGFSFKPTLEELKTRYSTNSPVKILTIHDSDNFDQALLNEIIDGILDEATPIEIDFRQFNQNTHSPQINKKDRDALKQFLTTRLLASQIRSTLFSDEFCLPENGKYFEAFFDQLIQQMANALSDFTEDNPLYTPNSKQPKKFSLFDKTGKEWRLSKRYRTTQNHYLHTNKTLIKRVNAIINSIENELLVMANPESTYQKTCEQLESTVNREIVGKFNQISLLINIGLNHQLQAEYTKLQNEFMIHSGHMLSPEHFLNAKIFQILTKFISDIELAFKTVFENSLLPESYRQKTLAFTQSVVQRNSFIAQILENHVHINAFVLFELLAKRFKDGMHSDYSYQTGSPMIIPANITQLADVNKKYAYRNKDGKIGPDVKKWFFDLKRQFNDYYAYQLDEDDLTDCFALVDLAHANLGELSEKLPKATSPCFTPSSPTTNQNSPSTNQRVSTHSTTPPPVPPRRSTPPSSSTNNHSFWQSTSKTNQSSSPGSSFGSSGNHRAAAVGSDAQTATQLPVPPSSPSVNNNQRAPSANSPTPSVGQPFPKNPASVTPDFSSQWNSRRIVLPPALNIPKSTLSSANTDRSTSKPSI